MSRDGPHTEKTKLPRRQPLRQQLELEFLHVNECAPSQAQQATHAITVTRCEVWTLKDSLVLKEEYFITNLESSRCRKLWKILVNKFVSFSVFKTSRSTLVCLFSVEGVKMHSVHKCKHDLSSWYGGYAFPRIKAVWSPHWQFCFHFNIHVLEKGGITIKRSLKQLIYAKTIFETFHPTERLFQVLKTLSQFPLIGECESYIFLKIENSRNAPLPAPTRNWKFPTQSISS